MSWINKNEMVVDRSYQRTLQSRRSKSLIDSLTANFRWMHCSPLVGCERADGKIVIIDGQHRLAAAKRIPAISLLPCYVVDELTVAQQAHAFVAHNSARVTVTPLQLFHAKAVAGDAEAVAILDACAAAGVKVLRSQGGAEKADETGSLGILTSIYRKDGAQKLTEVLRILRAAYPKKDGQLTSFMIGAVRDMLARNHSGVTIIVALRGTDDKTLRLEAQFARASAEEVRLRDAYTEALAKLVEKTPV